jgi:hypothetical protein
MTLPVNPDVETVLRSCAETLRGVLLPEIESDWGRYSGELCVASLEYAIGLLAGDRNAPRREELARALAGLRSAVEASGSAEMSAALSESSPFEAASKLLVAGQNEPGDTSDRIREQLHPLLYAQLDDEMAAAMPLFIAFAKNMAG